VPPRAVVADRTWVVGGSLEAVEDCASEYTGMCLGGLGRWCVGEAEETACLYSSIVYCLLSTEYVLCPVWEAYTYCTRTYLPTQYTVHSKYSTVDMARVPGRRGAGQPGVPRNV
jgi:hypothetical protein